MQLGRGRGGVVAGLPSHLASPTSKRHECCMLTGAPKRPPPPPISGRGPLWESAADRVHLLLPLFPVPSDFARAPASPALE